MWTFEITGSQVYATFLAMMLLKWIAHGWVRMLDARLDELRRPTSVQRNKCMFYVLEAIVTTAGLVLYVTHASWRMVLRPRFWQSLSAVSSPSPTSLAREVTHAIRAVGVPAYLVCLMYTLEIFGVRRMRASLRLHHVASVGMCYGMYVHAVYFDSGSFFVLGRIAHAFVVYALTEQNVFVFLFLYRLLPQTPLAVFRVLGHGYGVSRVLVTGLCVYTTALGVDDMIHVPSSALQLVRNVVLYVGWTTTVVVIGFAQWRSYQAVREMLRTLHNNNNNDKHIDGLHNRMFMRPCASRYGIADVAI